MGGEAAPPAGGVDAAGVMAELRRRVRERLRADMTGANHEFDDPELFAAVEQVLRSPAITPESARLILPELLGEPSTWRLTTSIKYASHRGPGAASLLTFVKRRLLMPVLRWLYEYSRDNFERQRRTNHVLFACVQELALEIVLLRRELNHVSPTRVGTADPSPGTGTQPDTLPGR